MIYNELIKKSNKKNSPVKAGLSVALISNKEKKKKSILSIDHDNDHTPFHFCPWRLNNALPNNGSTSSPRKLLWSRNESKSLTVNFFSNFGSRIKYVGVENSNRPDTLVKKIGME